MRREPQDQHPFDAEEARALHPKLRAVTFDLWATVLGHPREGGLARHHYRLEAMTEVFSQLGPTPDRATLEDLVKRDWARFDRIWYGEQRTLPNHDRAQWMASELGVGPLPTSLADRLVEAFDQSIWEG